MSPRYPSTLEGQRDFQRPADNAWRTVSYYSEPMGRALGFVIIFGVLAIFLLGLSIGIVWLTQLQAMWILIIACVLGTLAFMLLLPTYFRHTQEGIDHARIAADLQRDIARINADYAVRIAQAEVLQTQADTQRLQLERGAAATLNRPAQSDLNRIATWVPNIEAEEEPSHWTQPLRNDVMVQTMLTWAGAVYNRIGPDGRIRDAVPWAQRGGLAPADGKRAQQWLTDVARAQATGWVAEYRTEYRGWYLNIRRYPDAVALVNALSSTPPPRGDDE